MADVADALENLSLQDDDVSTSTSSTYYLSAIQSRHVHIEAAGELFVSSTATNPDHVVP